MLKVDGQESFKRLRQERNQSKRHKGSELARIAPEGQHVCRINKSHLISSVRSEMYLGGSMANTYSQIYIQVIFAVQGRHNILRPEHKEELHRFISGIIKNKSQILLRINSVPDHVHILLGLKPDIALSDLVRDIKANSSRFVNSKGWVKGRFNWQEGFGAFSYSDSQLDRVIRYIDDQERHHRKTSFKDEYIYFLEKFRVNFDPNYLFNWIDEKTTMVSSRS